MPQPASTGPIDARSHLREVGLEGAGTPVWKHEYSVKRASVITAGAILLIVAAFTSGLWDLLDSEGSRPLNFSGRHFLGVAPPIDPRLKLIAQADVPPAGETSSDLDTTRWRSLLIGLARRHPAMILVGYRFSSLWPPNEAAELLAAVRQLNVPLISTALVTPETIDTYPILTLENKAYNLDRYARAADAAGLSEDPELNFYGPSGSIAAVFTAVGHLQLEPHLKTLAFYRPSASKVIPHAALFAAERLELDRSGAIADGSRLSLDNLGTLTINLVDYQALRAQTQPVDAALTAFATNGEVGSIAKGDFVFVMPGAFAGGSRWVKTPTGSVPESYLHAMVLNSVLTGRWLRSMGRAQEACLAVVGAVVAGTIAFALPPALSIATLSVGLLACMALGLTAFIWGSWCIPWLGLCTVWCSTGAAVLWDRRQSANRFVARLRDALSGQLAPEQIQDALRAPERLDLRPRATDLTMMFIDLAGFSRSAEDLPAEQLFAQLKDHLHEMRSTIHKYRGFIDRSLGDGLLCYFGFRPHESVPASSTHADEALACAIEMQQLNLQRNLAARSSNRISHPMRIGLNSASVCLGDLGDSHRIDLTVIGHGVNFAKRLETGCENYRIMLSSSTRQALAKTSYDAAYLHKRFVQVKHHPDLLEAYEYDPLGGLEDEKMEAMRHYWSLIGVRRKDSRYEIRPAANITIKTTLGSGQLMNFSSTGIAFTLDCYIACGANIGFLLDDPDGKLGEQCRSRRVLPLEVEIRWGQVIGDKFLHGAMLKGLNAENRLWLFNVLTKFSVASEVTTPAAS